MPLLYGEVDAGCGCNGFRDGKAVTCEECNINK